jgi:hypothetical protein
MRKNVLAIIIALFMGSLLVSCSKEGVLTTSNEVERITIVKNDTPPPILQTPQYQPYGKATNAFVQIEEINKAVVLDYLNDTTENDEGEYWIQIPARLYFGELNGIKYVSATIRTYHIQVKGFFDAKKAVLQNGSAVGFICECKSPDSITVVTGFK